MQAYTSPVRLNTLLSEALDQKDALLSTDKIGVIAASPEAPLAQEIWSQLDEIKRAGISLSVVFGSLKTSKAHRQVVDAYRNVFGTEATIGQLRNISGWRVRHLNEQLLLNNKAYCVGQAIHQKHGTPIKDLFVVSLDGAENKSEAALLAAAYGNVFRTAKTFTETAYWRLVDEWMTETQNRPAPKTSLTGAQLRSAS